MEGFNGYVKAGSIAANTTANIKCHDSRGNGVMCNTFSIVTSGLNDLSGCGFLFTPSSLIVASALGTLTAATLTAASGYIGTVIRPGGTITLGAGRYVSSFDLRNLSPIAATVVINYGVTTQLNPNVKYPLV